MTPWIVTKGTLTLLIHARDQQSALLAAAARFDGTQPNACHQIAQHGVSPGTWRTRLTGIADTLTARPATDTEVASWDLLIEQDRRRVR